MIKVCRFCQKTFEGAANKDFCRPKCKKDWHNSQRTAPTAKKAGEELEPSAVTMLPPQLDGHAAAYWQKIAPTLVKRGHLNVLSEDAFAELCDLVGRLRDINGMINETNRSLLQVDNNGGPDQGALFSLKDASKATQSFKESALSDIKRKYSRLLLDFCKQFYLTPLSNRGNFSMAEREEDDFDKFMRGKNDE